MHRLPYKIQWGGGVKLQLTALQKMTEFGLVWTATLDGPESVGIHAGLLLM
jgi:hypothetical protein